MSSYHIVLGTTVNWKYLFRPDKIHVVNHQLVNLHDEAIYTSDAKGRGRRLRESVLLPIFESFTEYS